jgi:hypothetical protein
MQTGSSCKHLSASKPQPSSAIIICTLRSRDGTEEVRVVCCNASEAAKLPAVQSLYGLGAHGSIYVSTL